VLASITQTVTDGVVSHGVVGVFLLMAVDALLPVGGELVMVVAGAIAAGALTGHASFLGHTLATGSETYVVLSLAGVLGSLAGALVGWLIGERIGHETLARHGHLVHLGPGRLARAERWFDRYGGWAVLIGRLTPLVRSFISIPAGLFGEPLRRYTALTTLASAIWCFGFAGLGWALGSSYDSVDQATHVVEALIVVGLVVGVVLLIRRRRASAATSRLDA
jgi:membrane protein DedA with SNARE-associated domain